MATAWPWLWSPNLIVRSQTLSTVGGLRSLPLIREVQGHWHPVAKTICCMAPEGLR
jgi:hypothetical protein